MKAVFETPNDRRSSGVSTPIGLLHLLARNLAKLDYLQITAIAILFTYSLVFIYSTGCQLGGPMTGYWKKQLVWIAFGCALWAFFAYSDYRQLGLLSPLVYAFCVLLLVMVLVHGETIYGAKRWLRVAGGVKAQPTEFAKIGALLVAGWLCSRPGFRINNLFHCGLLCAVIGLPFLLIIKQPDLGSAIVFPAMLAAIVFTAGFKWRWIVLLTTVGAALVTFVLIDALHPDISPFKGRSPLKSYQKERILVFLDPDRDPQKQGWTSRQSRLAVGSGGFFGKGVMRGTQNALGFLPKTVSNSDFIFSVIAEETGFVGSCLLIGAYLLLIASALRTAFFASDIFGMTLAVGAASIFFVHSFVNIGMNVRLMPITGLPLPLVSYGGSFMVSSMILLGLLQSVYTRRHGP